MMIVGIDEVGRGCWAGPVVAGAVILPARFEAAALIGWQLGDSKLLNKRQREAAEVGIRQVALAVGLGWVDAVTLDEVGLTAAVRLAMELALAEVDKQLGSRSNPVGTTRPSLSAWEGSQYDEIIIDGHYNFMSDNPKARAVIKADASVPVVSAASIVAKVARDRYMTELAAGEYPDYGFERHVGYGTALHLERLKLHGVSDLHRRSFRPVRELLAAG